MAEVKSIVGLRRCYHRSPTEVRTYFSHLPKLIDEFPFDVALAYVFAQVELAQNMTLYCGAVKLHRCDATLARNAINTHFMTRKGFREQFEVIFATAIPDKISKDLRSAEKVRDLVMHGKNPSAARKRQAIADVLSYAKAFNDFVASSGGFRPFGSLQGFKGAGKALDKKTTRWVLKGMGFPIA